MHGQRLLILIQGVPHRSRGASSVLFFHYADHLCRSGREALVVLMIRPGNENSEALQQFKMHFNALPGISVDVVITDGIIRSSRFSHHLNTEILGPLRGRVAAFKPDISVAFDLGCAWLAARLPLARRTVWLGDLNFDSYWYNSLYGWKEGTVRPWHMVWALFQRRAWRRIYARVLAVHDSVVVSSKSSEPALGALGIKARYLPYPWPQDGAVVEKPIAMPQAEVPTFVFFGTLEALGFRSGFHFLAEEILPQCRRVFGAGNFRIFICGNGSLPQWASDLMATRPEITSLGFVGYLGELFDRAHAAIFPIDVPVGNRSRILTAAAHGLLTIAHPNVSLGNPDLVDGETCLLADNAEAFVAHMERAAARPGELFQLRQRARDMYVRLFTPGPACARFTSETINDMSIHPNIDAAATAGGDLPV